MMQEEQLDWLERWSLYTPEKIALVDVVSNQSYSYKDCFQIVNRLAFHLEGLGVKSGDRVAVFAHNSIETVFLFFALQRLNAILVPINFRLAPNEADFILSDSGANLLFVGPNFSGFPEKLKTTIESRPLSELASFYAESKLFNRVFPFKGEYNSACKILYTSGTTGFPKGVVITPKILFWNSINTSLSLNLSSEDRTVNFSPFFHTGGWNVLLTPFIHRGATTYLLPQFDSEKILEIIESEKITVFFGVPTTLSMMARSENFESTDLTSVRYGIVGGEPMPLNMIKLWHQKGVAIRQGFGMTECGPNCFSLSEEQAESKIGSIGRPNFYVQTRIIDENNQDVAIGETGELLLRGPMCMTHYWNNQDATLSSFYDGWLRTGDLVRRDHDRDFFVVGRKKEMFISGGENIYPVEIEKVISTHPQVAEVAVLGVEDPQWGEVGRAFVVTRNQQPIPAENLTQFCRQRLAAFKVPKQFEFLESLPKGDSGKILKKDLKNFIYNQGVSQ